MDFSEAYRNYKEKVERAIQSGNINDIIDLLEEGEIRKDEYHNMELVVKADANSLYGVAASDYFSLVDYDMAEDITNTGKSYLIVMDIAINKFFTTWGNNLDNLKKIQEFYPQCTGLINFTEYKPDTINDICVYGDTDSRYIDFGKIYELLEGIDFPANTHEGNDELSNFVTFTMKNIINPVIEKCIEEETEYRNHRKGFLIMEHEVTGRKSVYQKKKKYVVTQIWKDGKLLKEPKLKVTGVELKKGELAPRMKKILSVLVNKFLIEDYDEDMLRIECLKLMKYIKSRKEKSFIYRITSVSNLKEIYKNSEGLYVSDKTHIQMKIACSWMNFIEKNNLQKEYKAAFERQKMMYYYDIQDNVIGVPDDVNIDKVPGLPEPNWNKMLFQTMIKPLLKYIYDDEEEFDDKTCEMFLLGVKKITKL